MRSKWIHITSGELASYQENAVKFAENLLKLVERAPPEYQKDVTIEFEVESDYDSSYVKVYVGYNRPETETERRERDE